LEQKHKQIYTEILVTFYLLHSGYDPPVGAVLCNCTVRQPVCPVLARTSRTEARRNFKFDVNIPTRVWGNRTMFTWKMAVKTRVCGS